MTMAAEGRVRRSVRFAQLNAETSVSARNVSVRRERIHTGERLEMPSFQHTQDWAGSVGISPSGRFQVQAHPGKKQKPFSRAGVRTDWAGAILWVLVAAMCVALLVRFASVGAAGIRIHRLETRIAAAENRGNQLRSDLAVSGGDISVCTKAVELNLISSGGAPTIYLTAPERADMNLMTETEVQTTEEPELRASAGGVN